MRILVVEDEAEIARDISRSLGSLGYAVECCDDGPTAWFKGSTENYAAIVLDVGLPHMDGISILKNWRMEKVATPVIILTARGNWTDKVDGIESGADDYLAKPFHIEELMARVKALVRRSAGVASPILEIGALKLDTRSAVTTLAGVRLDLGPLEFRLLSHLMMNSGKSVSQSELTEVIYGAGGEPGSNAVEALVRRLRKKIGSDIIHTHRGYGYIIGGPKL
jgi:two-component system, OmpR family, response regulator